MTTRKRSFHSHSFCWNCAMSTRRWPDRRDPRNSLSTPSRRGPPPPQDATSPAGLFRSGQGTEVAGLPIGTRVEPSPPRVLNGSALWEQGIWPASLSQPGCGTTEGAGGRTGCGAGAAGHAGGGGGAGRPQGITRRTPGVARFESPAAVPPTPFELLGLPPHLLANTQFAQRCSVLQVVSGHHQLERTPSSRLL